MKKQTQIRWATGVLLLVSIAIISENSFSGTSDGRSTNSRWESRFKKDSSAGATATTTTESTAANDKIKYGTGTANCRDAFVSMPTHYDRASDSQSSRLKVKALDHLKTQSYDCVAASPSLYNDDGFIVESGQITVQCKNGAVFIQDSTCKGKTMAEYRAEQEAIRIAEEKRKAAEAAAAAAAAEAARIAAEKKAAEEAAAAAAAAANPQCYGCSASATCVVKTEYQISKNASGYRTTYYYACSNGNSKVTYSSGSSGCVTGQKVCSSSSSSSK